MSGLQALLSAGAPGGLHRWPREVPVASAEREATEAGWQVVRLSTSEVPDKRGFLSEISRALSLPDYFGHNWDALEECLQDLAAPAGILVLWEGWAELARVDPDTFEIALDVLGERARNPRGAAFAVVLVGGDDSLEIPVL